MFAKISIQTRLIIFVVVTVGLLAIVLQTITTIKQRDALENAERKRSLAVIGNVNNTIDAARRVAISLQDMSGLENRLVGLVSQNEGIDFIAVTWLDGEVIVHSDGTYNEQTIIQLANLPDNQILHKEVPGMGDVYLTARIVDMGNLEGRQNQFQIVVGAAAEPINDQIRNSILSSILITLVAVISFSLMLIFLLQYTLVKPIRTLSEAALNIRAGNLAQRAQITGQDEIGDLARSFNSMAEQLQGLVFNLEEHVNARTRDLEVAADVSRQITTVLDINALLQQVVRLTTLSFDFYASLVFSLDEKNENLTLLAGIDSSGRTIDGIPSISIKAEPSVIALAARKHEAITVNDIRDSSVYMSLELLPETRSEVAIPLLLGGRLLGVFDLQSEVSNRFKAEDLRVLTALAEQITIALHNAQLYTEAQVARQEAERANRIKSHFLAAMSHELRTPLNAILNLTKLVSEGLFGIVNDQQKELLTQVVESGDHLLHLINDLLDISKIEAGSLKLFAEKNVDIQTIMDIVLSTARSLLKDKDKSVELIYTYDDTLPEMVVDKRRVLQILLNIVSNACKFTQQGSINIHIRHEGAKIIISIKDTGPGIPPEEHAAVFEVFRQTGSGLAHGGGTGLGMPISKRLAEAHGGQLWLESATGQGATFYVALPVQSEALLALIEQEKEGK